MVSEAVLEGRVKSAEGKVYLGKTPGLVCSENARSQAEDWTILLSGSSGAPKETAADAARSASPRAQPTFSEAHPTLITPTPQSSVEIDLQAQQASEGSRGQNREKNQEAIETMQEAEDNCQQPL